MILLILFSILSNVKSCLPSLTGFNCKLFTKKEFLIFGCMSNSYSRNLVDLSDMITYNVRMLIKTKHFSY